MYFYYTTFQSPLGVLLLVADNQAVHIVELISDQQLDEKINNYRQKLDSTFELRSNGVLDVLQKELKSYFEGTLQQFTVLVAGQGTPFQQTVWKALQKISYGKTVSYQQIAASVGSPKGMRAVGGANGANPIMILIPCHRVIQANGKLGGYAGGIEHKKWLLEHEMNCSKK